MVYDTALLECIIGNSMIPLSLSIGVASGRAENGDSLTDIIQQADCVMYQEKRIYQQQVRENLNEMLKQ